MCALQEKGCLETNF